MRVAIVGGGVNGLSCAWTIASKNHQVTLFEKGELMRQTSSASSKLLHGGLRYLENGEFRLVREALHERDSWLKRTPQFAQPLRIIIPIYRTSRRGLWLIRAGLYLYKFLAGNSIYRNFCWLSSKELAKKDPNLVTNDLVGGYEFYDGQMDDYKLGLWIAEQARNMGAELREHTEIISVSEDGKVTDAYGNTNQYDRVINVSGPWAEELCKQSNCEIPYQLDLVRGSHLIIRKLCTQAYILEILNENRIFFILPWKGKTLIGTTEVRQRLDEPIECTKEEEAYLLKIYNHYQTEKVTEDDVTDRFSGLRPLVKSALDPSRATREYIIHRSDRLITVLGGKWTTSLALSKQVAKTIQ